MTQKLYFVDETGMFGSEAVSFKGSTVCRIVPTTHDTGHLVAKLEDLGKFFFINQHVTRLCIEITADASPQDNATPKEPSLYICDAVVSMDPYYGKPACAIELTDVFQVPIKNADCLDMMGRCLLKDNVFIFDKSGQFVWLTRLSDDHPWRHLSRLPNELIILLRRFWDTSEGKDQPKFVSGIRLDAYGYEGACANLHKWPKTDIALLEVYLMRNADDRGSVDIMRSFAHEANGPLVSLQLCLEMLSDCFRDGKGDDFWNWMAIANLQMDFTLAQMSTYQFLSGGKILWNAHGITDIADFIETRVYPFLYRAKEELPFRIECCRGEVNAQVDSDKLQVILINVLKNSLEAMETTHERKSEAKIRATVKDGNLEIEVADNGTGFSELERVFDPGVSTKPRHTGYGLTVVQGFVQLAGGSVDIQNNIVDGIVNGCTVLITLPCQNLPGLDHSNPYEHPSL